MVPAEKLPFSEDEAHDPRASSAPREPRTSSGMHETGAGPASGMRTDRGERNERETTPAPPGSAEEQLASLPSARPTSVPDFDLLALSTGALAAPPARLPLDVAVPTRTGKPAPPDLGLRSAFLLLHVDDEASIALIAEMTSIPADVVVAHLIELVALGLVELGGTRTEGPSGVVPSPRSTPPSSAT